MSKGIVSFVLLVVFSVSSYADVSPELEKMIQQLDWDMTRIGSQGRKARNRAVTKLTCIGKRGNEERDRVLQTAGRLLDHENLLIPSAASQIFINLGAQSEENRYRQSFYLRYGSPQNEDEIENILAVLTLHSYEGLEMIHEFYPTQDEGRRLNRLADSFFQRTGRMLKLRFRVFSSAYPSSQEWETLAFLHGEVITDFHVGTAVPTDSACSSEVFK